MRDWRNFLVTRNVRIVKTAHARKFRPRKYMYKIHTSTLLIHKWLRKAGWDKGWGGWTTAGSAKTRGIKMYRVSLSVKTIRAKCEIAMIESGASRRANEDSEPLCDRRLKKPIRSDSLRDCVRGLRAFAAADLSFKINLPRIEIRPNLKTVIHLPQAWRNSQWIVSPVSWAKAELPTSLDRENARQRDRTPGKDRQTPNTLLIVSNRLIPIDRVNCSSLRIVTSRYVR